jgi:polysaccharide biosynthesis transport protein
MSQLTPFNTREVTTYTTSAGPQTGNFQEVGRFISAVLAHKRLFVAIAGGFALIVGFITLLTPKTYTTTVRLMAGSPATQMRGGDTALPILNALMLQSGDQSAETFATLAQQEGVATLVQRKLHLSTSPGSLLSHLKVTPVANTPILNLSVTWRDAETSAGIANAFGDAFMEREREFVQSQAVAALGFLQSELPQAEARMRQTSVDLANYQAANGFVDANSHTQNVVAHATAIQGKIESTMLDSREAKALLNNVQRQLASMPESVNTSRQTSVNPVLTDLRTRLETVSLQLRQAEQQYTDQHPLVVSLRKQRQALLVQIAAEPAQINSQNTVAPNPIYQALQQQVAQYKQRVDGDEAQLALLRGQQKELSPVLQSLPQKSMELATFQQQAKLAADVYNALEQKYSDATIARSTALSDISVVQAATADSAVVRPNLKVNFLAALVVGFILASIAVVIVDAVEHRVRTMVSEGRILGLPLIARIPAFAPVSRSMLPWVQSMTIEAFLHLCVTLRLKTKGPLRTLAVTSPCRGDGKSTIAFNLAKAMATLEPRILLIDGDMRRPTLHELAGCANAFGLSEVLDGSRSLSDSVHEVAPNLDLLASGVDAENPVSLLRGTKFDELMTLASERYAMVIVDTPALGVVTDGLLVSARVDGTVIVLAENTTDEAEAQRIITQFSALGINNVLGVVLNMDTKRVTDYTDYITQGSRTSALPGGPQ